MSIDRKECIGEDRETTAYQSGEDKLRSKRRKR